MLLPFKNTEWPFLNVPLLIWSSLPVVMWCPKVIRNRQNLNRKYVDQIIIFVYKCEICGQNSILLWTKPHLFCFVGNIPILIKLLFFVK